VHTPSPSDDELGTMLYAGAMSRWTKAMIVTMLAAVLAVFIASRGLLVAEHSDDVVRVFYSTSEYPMSLV
jgi:hypothetical protein